MAFKTTSESEKAFFKEHLIANLLLDGASYFWPVLAANAGYKLMFSYTEYQHGLKYVKEGQTYFESKTNLKPLLGIGQLALILTIAMLPQTQAVIWPFVAAAVFNGLWSLAVNYDVLTDDHNYSISYS